MDLLFVEKFPCGLLLLSTKSRNLSLMKSAKKILFTPPLYCSAKITPLPYVMTTLKCNTLQWCCLYYFFSCMINFKLYESFHHDIMWDDIACIHMGCINAWRHAIKINNNLSRHMCDNIIFLSFRVNVRCNVKLSHLEPLLLGAFLLHCCLSRHISHSFITNFADLVWTKSNSFCSSMVNAFSYNFNMSQDVLFISVSQLAWHACIVLKSIYTCVCKLLLHVTTDHCLKNFWFFGLQCVSCRIKFKYILKIAPV